MKIGAIGADMPNGSRLAELRRGREGDEFRQTKTLWFCPEVFLLVIFLAVKIVGFLSYDKKCTIINNIQNK